MKRLPFIVRLIIVMLWGVVVVGCNEQETRPIVEAQEMNSQVYFPKQEPAVNGERIRQTALFSGVLTQVGDCLRLEGGDESSLLLFPNHYRFDISSRPFQIVDSTTNEVLATVGDSIDVGGGLTSKIPINEETYINLPSADICSGPYLVVGDILK
ncbi:MAG TPA: hypothetical protein VLL52_20135 [Anaerolineae bacterium]|nr:hypothetical protein [Anaerolineae bacterium]